MRFALLVTLLLLAADVFAQDPSVECVKRLPSDARFASIKKKLALGVTTDTTFAMLADETYPTKKERAAIAAWADARNECIKQGEEFRRTAYPPSVSALAVGGEQSLLLLAVDLYQRKISYGEFNKRREALVDELKKQIAAVVEKIKEQQQVQQQAEQHAQEAQRAREAQAEQEAQQEHLAQEAQAEASRRQAYIQFLQNQAQQQAILQRQQIDTFLGGLRANQPRPRVSTDCQWFGYPINQMQCTTR